MSAPQGGTPAAVVNQPPAAPPTPSPDGTIGDSSAGTQQSAALSAAPVAPAAAGTTAAGTTAVAVGAGVGKRKQTSSIWRFTLPHKVEKMLLLRLNRHLIPGFAEVVKQLEALKAKCDVHAAVSVAAQNASEGDFVHVA